MSRFDVKPRSRSTLTSTHRPWQSNPFCQRWSSPSIAWKRWKRSLYARPQAWWTPIGLLAVIGPSRKLQRGPPAFWARSRANVPRSRHRSSSSCSWATRSGFDADGAEHRAWRASCGSRTRSRRSAVGPRRRRPPAAAGRDRVRVSYPRCSPGRRRGRAPGRRSPRRSCRSSFPGLGHAYAGAYQRALAFAAPPLLLLALSAGILLRVSASRPASFVGLLLPVLPAIFVLNLIALAYRIVAIVDAWRVAALPQRLDASGAGRLGRPRVRLSRPVGRRPACGAPGDVRGPRRRRPLRPPGLQTASTASSTPNGTCRTAAPSRRRVDRVRRAPAEASEPDAEPAACRRSGFRPAERTIPPWNGTERLNILLIGADERPDETPTTPTRSSSSRSTRSRSRSRCSACRATRSTCRCRPARHGTSSARSTPRRSTASSRRPAAAPTSSRGRPRRRAATTDSRPCSGELYGLDIKYFVEVNFDGFIKVIDALGGVTVNVQIPVVDDMYPGDKGRLRRIYIPGRGPAHDRRRGARLRPIERQNGLLDDFDRGQRQQRVLLSLRQQVDPGRCPPADQRTGRRDVAGHPDRHPGRASCPSS